MWSHFLSQIDKTSASLWSSWQGGFGLRQPTDLWVKSLPALGRRPALAGDRVNYWSSRAVISWPGGWVLQAVPLWGVGGQRGQLKWEWLYWSCCRYENDTHKLFLQLGEHTATRSLTYFESEKEEEIWAAGRRYSWNQIQTYTKVFLGFFYFIWMWSFDTNVFPSVTHSGSMRAEREWKNQVCVGVSLLWTAADSDEYWPKVGIPHDDFP